MTFRARDQKKINQKRKRFILEGEDEHRDGSWKTFLKKRVFWNRDWREKSWKLFGTGWAGWTDITLEII